MTIYGLTATEILMLQRWQRMCGLDTVPAPEGDPFADIRHMRQQWRDAGGTFPVCEHDIVFVRPKDV